MAVVPLLRNIDGQRSVPAASSATVVPGPPLPGSSPPGPSVTGPSVAGPSVTGPSARTTRVTAVSQPCPKQQLRCERCVRRAADAVETVSSFADRQALRAVVRRMDAELPNVRALAELERSLNAGEGERDAGERVHQQLDDAGVRFGVFADQVMEVVEQHVARPDREWLRTEVAVLRGQFPLLRPMSAILNPA